MRWALVPLVAIPLVALAACSTATSPDGIHDPYEGANRRVHAFNRGLDANLLKPLSKDEEPASPPETRGGPGLGGHLLQGVGNFGSNLSLPGKAVNHLLQGKVVPATATTFRFAVNSTLGLAGVLDPAGRDFGLPEQDTDFGQTLAVWGIPEGAYLELPLLGPSTERDAVGKVVDFVFDPLGSRMNRDQRLIAIGTKVVSKAGERAQYGDTVDSVLHESADSYAQTRLIWLQHRRHELGQEGEAIDPYAE